MSGVHIKNIDTLGTTALRRDALAVLQAGYDAVTTERVIKEEVRLQGDELCVNDRKFRLTDFERIFFIGIGKCAVDASLVFEEMLGDRITDGIVLDVKSSEFKRLRPFIGTHPLPSEANVVATKEIVRMLSGLTGRDLVLAFISGGGSALLCLPHKTDCATVSAVTSALGKAGATIHELNTVRKHLSDIQGGQLVKLVYPATVLTFIFSDVPGNDLGMIASGPTVPDKTTAADAERILAQYHILDRCQLKSCELVETPKDQKYFESVTNLLLVTNRKALEAMQTKAESLGYNAYVKNDAIEGFADELGRSLALETLPPNSCFLYGGETTVHVRGNGEGGRNQECALGALLALADDRVVVAAASDGWDNTDTAGAIVDINDQERARELGLHAESYLAANDSYHFWKKLGGSILTGRTGINVADFYFIIKRESTTSVGG